MIEWYGCDDTVIQRYSDTVIQLIPTLHLYSVRYRMRDSGLLAPTNFPPLPYRRELWGRFFFTSLSGKTHASFPIPLYCHCHHHHHISPPINPINSITPSSSPVNPTSLGNTDDRQIRLEEQWFEMKAENRDQLLFCAAVRGGAEFSAFVGFNSTI